MKLRIAALAVVVWSMAPAAHAQGVTNPAKNPNPIEVTIDGQTYSDGRDTLPGYDDVACTPIPGIVYDFENNQIQYNDSDGKLIKTADWNEWERISSYDDWVKSRAKPTPTATSAPTTTATQTPAAQNTGSTQTSGGSRTTTRSGSNRSGSTKSSSSGGGSSSASSSGGGSSASSSGSSSGAGSSSTGGSSGGSSSGSSSSGATASSSSASGGTTTDAGTATTAADGTVTDTAPATDLGGGEDVALASTTTPGGGGGGGGVVDAPPAGQVAESNLKLASQTADLALGESDTRLAGVGILVALIAIGFFTLAFGEIRNSLFGRR